MIRRGPAIDIHGKRRSGMTIGLTVPAISDDRIGQSMIYLTTCMIRSASYDPGAGR